MADVSKDTQQKISQLQLYEQSLNNLLVQKQQFQQQFVEINSALEELKNTDKAYKIIGNIMVASEKSVLQKDLNERKEMTELRIKSFEKQEHKIKEKASEIQAEVMKELKK